MSASKADRTGLCQIGEFIQRLAGRDTFGADRNTSGCRGWVRDPTDASEFGGVALHLPAPEQQLGAMPLHYGVWMRLSGAGRISPK